MNKPEQNPPLPAPAGSASRWITDTLPDSDMTVLIRLSGDEFPVWPGFHDGEQWCSASAETIEGPVLGWMELEDVALTLDGLVKQNGQGQARRE